MGNIRGRAPRDAGPGLARDLHREPDAAAVLNRIVGTATDVLAGIDHAAVTVVARDRSFITAAASDELPRRVDEIQYATGQGPCLDVLRHERTYYAPDLIAENRWPAFTRRTVADTGVRTMLSFQLLVDDDTLGALNFYGTRTGSFDNDELQALCAVFATQAALALARSLEHQQYLGMQAGRHDAGDIGVAIGITMERSRMDRRAATEELRGRARRQRQSLADTARDVISDTGPRRNDDDHDRAAPRG